MPNNQAIAVLLGAGAALLMMSGKKGKRGDSSNSDDTKINPEGDEDPNNGGGLSGLGWEDKVIPEFIDQELEELELNKESTLMRFNSDCTAWDNADSLDINLHNRWITTKYHQLYKNGVKDMGAITLEILKAQDEAWRPIGSIFTGTSCPWDEKWKWTPFMTQVYEQLLAAVSGYHDSLLTSGL